MTDARLKQKYREVKVRMHIVSPAEYKGLKSLMNYYYNMMLDRGIA